MNKHVIQVNDICFSYEKEMVLKHLTFNIREKQIYFIMGLNGSGKTTLLKNMMGFLIPQSGNIKINSTDVSTADKQTMSKLVSYVPQSIYMNTDFSVIDYLSLGRTPHIGLLSKLEESDYRIIERFSLRLGISSLYETSFNKLSGGQKQMVAITRSLIQDTPLIILDEPMSALDIGKQVDLLKLLYELVEEGKTIILTTHNPNHALAVKSVSCFLKEGEIISYGNSQEIIQEELLQKIYGNNITIERGQKSDSVVFNLSKNE